MEKFNLEITGKFKSTTKGNADWYYGGGNECWPDIPSALSGVPSAVRAGRTVGINVNGTIKEYIWHPETVGDLDLVLKNEIVFETDLGSSIGSSESFGALEENTPVSFYKGKTFSEIFEEAIFPEKLASIGTPSSLILSGVTPSILEVGTTINSLNLIMTFNRGSIVNGDGTVAGPLKGNSTSSVIRNIQGNNILSSTAPVNNTSSYTVNGFPIISGDNSWSVESECSSGDTDYFSSYEIEGSNLSGNVGGVTSTATSGVIQGRYRRWHYVGSEGTSPTTSANVRLLADTELLDSNNEGSFDLYISTGASSAEVTIYVPSGKNLLVKDMGNLGINISSEFEASNININDAGGTSRSYIKYTRLTGPTGYENPTNFNITII